MLLGHFDHTIDDKNRLTLPAKFRDDFADGAYVTPGLDGCLDVYSAAEFERRAQRVRSLDPLSRESRLMQRYFFASASADAPDKQGRIMLPSALLDAAKLAREVVVAGVYDHVEIWDRATWRAQLQEMGGTAEHVAERLAANRD